MTDERRIEIALEEGFAAAAVVDVEQIVVDPMFRPFCEENICGHYGVNYSCPPDCGTPEEMEARLRAFGRALVVQTLWKIDFTDGPAVRQAKGEHNGAMMRMMERMEERGLMCGASCCTLCAPCALKEGKPCRFPEKKWSCLSAYCIFVRKLAEACRMDYSPADGSLALFGLWAFD